MFCFRWNQKTLRMWDNFCLEMSSSRETAKDPSLDFRLSFSTKIFLCRVISFVICKDSLPGEDRGIDSCLWVITFVGRKDDWGMYTTLERKWFKSWNVRSTKMSYSCFIVIVLFLPSDVLLSLPFSLLILIHDILPNCSHSSFTKKSCLRTLSLSLYVPSFSLCSFDCKERMRESHEIDSCSWRWREKAYSLLTFLLSALPQSVEH